MSLRFLSRNCVQSCRGRGKALFQRCLLGSNLLQLCLRIQLLASVLLRVCFLSVSALTFRISCRTAGSSQIHALLLWVLRQAFVSFCALCSQTSVSLKRLPLGCVHRLSLQSQEEADTESLLALKGSQIHPSYTRHHRLPYCSCPGEFILSVLPCPRPWRSGLLSGDHIGFAVDQVTPATPVEAVLWTDRNTSRENPRVSLACHLIQKSDCSHR